MILTTSLYDMNQKKITRKVILKTSVDSNFTFTSCAWLCAMGNVHNHATEESYKTMQKIQILTIWEHLLYEIWDCGNFVLLA